MAVTIYVWDTKANIFTAGFDFDLEDHGHASALVAGEYVSFWPAEDSQGTRRKRLATDLRTAYYPDDYREDCSYDAMNRSADHIITIYKLKESVMLSYWEGIIRTKTKFEFMSSNCSTVVGRMLLQGWKASSQHLSYSVSNAVLSHAQHAQNYYWEPSDVLSFAQAIRGAIG